MSRASDVHEQSVGECTTQYTSLTAEVLHSVAHGDLIYMYDNGHWSYSYIYTGIHSVFLVTNGDDQGAT